MLSSNNNINVERCKNFLIGTMCTAGTFGIFTFTINMFNGIRHTPNLNKTGLDLYKNVLFKYSVSKSLICWLCWWAVIPYICVSPVHRQIYMNPLYSSNVILHAGKKIYNKKAYSYKYIENNASVYDYKYNAYGDSPDFKWSISNSK